MIKKNSHSKSDFHTIRQLSVVLSAGCGNIMLVIGKNFSSHISESTKQKKCQTQRHITVESGCQAF